MSKIVGHCYPQYIFYLDFCDELSVSVSFSDIFLQQKFTFKVGFKRWLYLKNDTNYKLKRSVGLKSFLSHGQDFDLF